MADVQHRAAVLLGGLAHLGQTLFLELHVADGQDLVHDHDLAVQMGSDAESQLDVHAAGVALDRGVDEVPDLGELDDLFHFGVDLGAGHAQNGTIEVDVLAARHLGVETGADFQHRGHAAVQVNIAGGRGRHVGQQLEQRGLARAVGADDTHGLSFVYCKADAVERHKGGAHQALVGADLGVGVFFAALAGPPALQVAAQRTAADLAQAVLFFDVLHADHQFLIFHAVPPVKPYRQRSFRPCRRAKCLRPAARPSTPAR